MMHTYFPRPAVFAFEANVTGPRQHTIQQNLHDLIINFNIFAIIFTVQLYRTMKTVYSIVQNDENFSNSYPPHLHNPCFHCPFLIPYFKFMLYFILILIYLGTIIYSTIAVLRPNTDQKSH